MSGWIGATFAAAFLASAVPRVSAEPAVDIQTRCFELAEHPGRLMRLRLLAVEDGTEAAFVRYADGKAWIPLVLLRRRAFPMTDGGRVQVDTDWAEVVQGQIQGHYALSMLGNEVNSFAYVDRKRSHTAFMLAPTPRGVDPCEHR